MIDFQFANCLQGRTHMETAYLSELAGQRLTALRAFPAKRQLDRDKTRVASYHRPPNDGNGANPVPIFVQAHFVLC